MSELAFASTRAIVAKTQSSEPPFSGVDLNANTQRLAERQRLENEADLAATAACQEYLEVLDTYPAHPFHASTSEEETAQRAAYTQFIKTRTGIPDQLPFLERRQVAPNLDLPPTTFYLKKHEIADNSPYLHIMPYLPHPEYFDQPDLPTWQPVTELDHFVLEVLKNRALPQAAFIANQINPVPSDAVISEHPLEYAAWAESTAISGVSWHRSVIHQDRMTNVMTYGQVRESGFQVVPEGSNAFYLWLPGDLEQESKRIDSKLHALMITINGLYKETNKTTTHPFECAQEATQLLDTCINIVDVCRWHIDHQVETSFFTEILFQTYAQISVLTQLAHNVKHETTLQGKVFSDVINLISGYRVGLVHLHGGMEDFNGQVDYFDAFSIVANYPSISHLLRDNPDLRKSDRDFRTYFTNPTHSHEQQHQILAVMAVLYLRMPPWQREAYEELIYASFRKILVGLPHPDDPFIPEKFDLTVELDRQYTVKSGNDSYSFNKNLMSLLGKSLHLQLATVLADSSRIIEYDQMTHKPDGRLEAIVGAGKEPMGLGAGEVFVDEFGFVCSPTDAPRRKSTPTELATAAPEKRESLLAKIAELPGVLAVSRVGEKLLARIETMLQRNLESGSVAAVGAVAGLIEKILGKKLDKANMNFINLIQQLGLVNTEVFTHWQKNEAELRAMIERCQKGEATVFDLDEAGLLITLFATTGEIPRQLLAEQSWRCYENLATLTTIQTILALHEIQDHKGSSLFGRKEKAPINTVLQARDELAALIEAQQAAFAKKHPEANDKYDPQTDPIFRAQAEKVIEKITTLLHKNRSYQQSMSSTLAALAHFQEKGELFARCAVDGELLTAILKFISPALLTYMATTYGAEALMAPEKWYQHLETARGSGDQSHAFNQTDWPAKTPHPDLTVADATGNFAYRVAGTDCQIDPERTAVMEHGRASLQGISNQHHTQSVIAHCLDFGSPLIASLAGDAKQFEYALQANPDAPTWLIWRIVEESNDIPSRLEALDKLVILEPHYLAMTPQGDYTVASTINRLKIVIDLGLQYKRWGAAIMSSQVLRTAAFFPEDAREQGNAAYQVLIRSLAMLPEAAFDTALTQADSLLAPADHQLIESERTKWLAELAAQLAKAQSEAEAQQLEEALRAKNTAALQEQHAEAQAAIETISFEVARREAAEQAANPTTGHLRVKQVQDEVATRSKTLSALNSDGSSTGVLGDRFELVTPENANQALIALVTKPDGTQLTGEALRRQLGIISSVLTKAAFELAEKQIHTQLGDTAAATLATPRGEIMLMNSARSFAEALAAGLQETATRLSIDLPTYSFTEATAQLVQHQYPSLTDSILPQLTAVSSGD